MAKRVQMGLMAQSRPGAESGSLVNGHFNKGEPGAQQNDAAGPFSIYGPMEEAWVRLSGFSR